MSETIYFKQNKDIQKIYKAEWQEDFDYESPRKEHDNLGTMVFIKNRNGAFGDEQVEDWGQFFLEELQKNEQIEVAGTQKLPLNGIAQNPKFKKYFENGEFDKELFTQGMDSVLSNVKKELGEDVCKNLLGSFSVDEDGVITDDYEIDFSAAISKRTSEDCSINAQKILDAVYNTLKENLNIYPYVSNLNVESELDKLTDSQLYERWKDSKAAVLPINLYIHSGETCHEASVRKTRNASNDRDDGFIYNDGFIYVDKDSEEFLNELKGEARDSNGKVYNTWKPKTEEEAKKWAEENIRAEPEKTFSFLSEKAGIAEKEKQISPINIKDENIKAYIATIKNPNRSDNGGLAKLLLVDEKNKSFAYFNSPSYIIQKGDIFGKLTNLGSGKRVEDKVKELSRYGFKDVNVSNESIAKYQKHFSEKDLNQDYQRER